MVKAKLNFLFCYYSNVSFFRCYFSSFACKQIDIYIDLWYIQTTFRLFPILVQEKSFISFIVGDILFFYFTHVSIIKSYFKYLIKITFKIFPTKIILCFPNDNKISISNFLIFLIFDHFFYVCNEIKSHLFLLSLSNHIRPPLKFMTFFPLFLIIH